MLVGLVQTTAILSLSLQLKESGMELSAKFQAGPNPCSLCAFFPQDPPRGSRWPQHSIKYRPGVISSHFIRKGPLHAKHLPHQSSPVPQCKDPAGDRVAAMGTSWLPVPGWYLKASQVMDGHQVLAADMP